MNNLEPKGSSSLYVFRKYNLWNLQRQTQDQHRLSKSCLLAHNRFYLGHKYQVTQCVEIILNKIANPLKSMTQNTFCMKSYIEQHRPHLLDSLVSTANSGKIC